MKNLTKKTKLVYIAFGIIMFVVLLSSLVFMTQYRYVRVNWDAANGLSQDAALNNQKQEVLYRLFDLDGKDYADGFPAELKGSNGESNFEWFAQSVFDYRLSLDRFNDLILWFGIVGLILFAIMLIFSNHSRRIYYKTNLIVGVLCPLAVIVYAIVLIVMDISLMSTFNANYNLFNLVSVAQNPLNLTIYRYGVEWNDIASKYTCNSLTFIVYIIIFAAVAAYAVYLMLFTVKKYKATAEHRKIVLEKAGVLND